MQIKADTVEQYLERVPKKHQTAIIALQETIRKNIPVGFQETISYGMIGYVVPHSIYPKGYHCNPKLPLPFINLAAQKNYIVLYHGGIYANLNLLEWFQKKYPKHCSNKLDMGKSCIRFKKTEQIPYDLIAELVRKMSLKDWITIYESKIKR